MEDNIADRTQVYDPETVRYLKEEFDRLRDNCYLDHAGSTLYSKTQMKNVMDDLSSGIYGNPHSLGIASKLTHDLVDQIRFRILDHFHTTSDDYSVVFTSGATDSLKLVANAFVFNGSGDFVHLEDNHTSVLGMREVVAAKGATVVSLGHQKAFEIFEGSKNVRRPSETTANNSLFVYPAQCNFSGLKYPLGWIKRVKEDRVLDLVVEEPPKEWFTFLDAAGFVPTNDMNLAIHRPDFVCVSFYKMFGYPTGLGALLVKKTAEKYLEKIYYGGGTVDIALSSETFHSKRPVFHERFEDGTVSFLSIISLRHGFDALEKIPLKKVTLHVFRLAKYLHDSLLRLHHANGKPLAILYRDTNYEDDSRQGGVVAFNLLRSNGENIGFVEVLNMANLHKIHLRTGCFCNPGACQRHLKLSNEELRRNFSAGHVCGDQRDLMDGKPTGAIRISFGYMSTFSDVDLLLGVIRNCFLQGPEVLKIPDWWEGRRVKLQEKFDAPEDGGFIIETESSQEYLPEKSMLSDEEPEENAEAAPFRLKKLFIYPVKSCGSFEVSDSWFIGDKGLSYDREWMITTASGVCLTQKQEIKLCLIRPIIRRTDNLLELNYPGMPPMKIPLKMNPKNREIGAVCRSKICGHKVEGIDCGSDVSEWLSLSLGRPGLRLVKQNVDATMSHVKKTPKISFSSQAQYLLINQSSIDWLAEKIPIDSCDRDSILDRFRGNVIVEGCQPFEEMKWKSVKIGKTRFQVDAQCTRCQMICIDQKTGKTTVEPLRTLAEEFHGKLRFGIYLSKSTSENGLLKIGDKVFYE